MEAERVVKATLPELTDFHGEELEQRCHMAENPRVPRATHFVLCLCGKIAVWDNEVISAQNSFLPAVN